MRTGNVAARLNRLLRAVSPAFARPDDRFARTRLPEAEFSVYARMDPRDREHATRVTKRLLELHPKASTVLVRAALLHDCGKLLRRYVWLERILVGLNNRVILDSGQDFKLPENWRTRGFTASQIRFLHPVLGAALILDAGGEARVAEIVARHHAPQDDADVRLIHDVDELE